jgi:cysteine desulfurase family protein (TIGR01976 family)
MQHAAPPAVELDLDAIRRQFPALNDEVAYLDNAGGSQVLRRVADRVHEYLLTTSVQLGASYTESQRAGERVVAARQAVAELINAPHDDEVVMGGSTTALLFLLTRALSSGIRPGDEIIVTDSDHEANIGGWMRLREMGAVVKVWRVSRETLELNLDDLTALLSPRVRWLALTWASNILGTVNPVHEIARRVHAVGGRVCVDAVAYAPHRLVDVQASGADVVVFSFYKVFGPHHAVLWGRRELLLSLPSLNHYFIGPEVIPYKLQPGNVNYELSYGCIGIGEYLRDTGTALGAAGTPRQRMRTAFDAFARHEDLLARQLLGWLSGKRGVWIIGRGALEAGGALDAGGVDGGRVPTVSFVVPGVASEVIVRHVDRFGIGIRFGDFYARRLIEALDLQRHGGVVRVSMAHYNTPAEVDRLIQHLDEVIA